MPMTTLPKAWGITAAALAVSLIPAAVNAGHYDIVPYATGTGSATALVTGGHDDLGDLPTQQGLTVFGYDFGETDPYFAGDPGFNNSSAFTTGVFPNNGRLPSGSLLLGVFSGYYGSLRYWDGSGNPNFVLVSGGIEINLNKGSSNLRVGATTTSGSLTIASILSSGASAGRVHTHLQSSIGAGGAGSSFATLGAPAGLYAFGTTLSVGGLVSDPIYLVFNQGMTEAVHDEGIDFYTTQIVPVPEPSTTVLAAIGATVILYAARPRRRRASSPPTGGSWRSASR
jgi:hypothetical protein